MNEKDFPTKGLRVFAKCFTRSYIGDPIVLIMGLSGMLDLCIFGKPYMCGMITFLGVSFFFVSSSKEEFFIAKVTYLTTFFNGSFVICSHSSDVQSSLFDNP